MKFENIAILAGAAAVMYWLVTMNNNESAKTGAIQTQYGNFNTLPQGYTEV